MVTRLEHTDVSSVYAGRQSVLNVGSAPSSNSHHIAARRVSLACTTIGVANRSSKDKVENGKEKKDLSNLKIVRNQNDEFENGRKAVRCSTDWPNKVCAGIAEARDTGHVRSSR